MDVKAALGLANKALIDLSVQKSRINNFSTLTALPFEIGQINDSTGLNVINSDSIRTPDYFTIGSSIYFEKSSNSFLYIFRYQADGTFISRQFYGSGTTSGTFGYVRGQKHRICYRRYPLETVTDVSIWENDFKFYLPGDKFNLIGKNWVTMGDSLTDDITLLPEDETENYTSIVARKLGLNLTNMGHSGTGYWRTSTTTQKAFYQIAPAIPTYADIVTIFGSFNDFGVDGTVHGQYIMGVDTDTTADTVAGCINLTLDAVFARVPNAVVGIIIPTPWNNMTTVYNTTYEPYADLLVKIAYTRSLPVLDLYHESNLRPWDATFLPTYYLNSDATHPNHAGHLRISGMIANFLEKIAPV